MRIVTEKTTKADLAKQSENFLTENVIKAVVDIDRHKLAVDAPMHADLEQFLLADGSKQSSLWGINLYLDEENIEDLIEFDSMINVRPSQNNRTRYVEDGETRKKIQEVVREWLM